MMVREASWEDVKMKGEWLYESGAFIIYKESTWEIVADVLGDNGTYTTSVNRRAKAEAYEGNEIPYWDCTCPWGNWAFARETYHGRMCAHAYCLWLYLRDKRRASRVSSVSPRLLTAGRKFTPMEEATIRGERHRPRQFTGDADDFLDEDGFWTVALDA